MQLNKLGALVQESWEEIPLHYPEVTLDTLQIMPSHLHATLYLEEAPGITSRHSLGTIVGSFKAAASKRIRAEIRDPGFPVWQTNYYEHVIRNEESLVRIRDYILNNPLKWELDRYNPHVKVDTEGDDWLDLLEQSS
jgi:REP element-mobilizing transposase RayT